MYKCKECEKEFNSWNGLSSHVNRTHKLTKEEYYVKHELNGNWPTCKCGCGEKCTWRAGAKYENDRFWPYVGGHKARIENFGNERGYKKSAETRRKRFATGEIKTWNGGVKLREHMGEEKYKQHLEKIYTEERSQKISKSLKGRKKSPEHIEKIKADRKEYWSKQENRDAQRERRVKWIVENGFDRYTGLEEQFKTILDNLNIEYDYQYPLDGKIYDFKIKGNILIEVDGDYFHANPKKYNKNDLNEMQINNIENDKVKTAVAQDNNYTLLRFWEDDIKNNIEYVENLIKKYL